MPCWYYDRRELDEMCHHGLDPKVVARYRKEGPRFILDCGGKMGLRYETCATGVVYFHRFYLFRSFKDFNRHVTAACCLFLAGKVEETPKKCKDIIKIARGMLTDQQFSSFGEDPREEVMTMERILLHTIKFDLQVEHPYSHLLRFAKILRGNDENNRDRDKIQAMVQMAWTFINDSMCTLLCLQWEPDILAVALMYLASRLKTFDIHQKGSGKGKWWNTLVEDITFELLEDICHQVLDLYSSPQQKQLKEESPPPPPPPKQPPPTGQPHKRSRSNTPSEGPDTHNRERGAPPPPKMGRHDGGRSKSPSPSPSKHDKSKPTSRHVAPHGPSTPIKARPSSNHVSPVSGPPSQSGSKVPSLVSARQHPRPDGMQYNPYLSSAMYGSSFMSGEGAQSIQSLMSGGGPSTPSTPASSGPPAGPPAGLPAGPPSTAHYSQPPPPSGPQYSQPTYAEQPPPPFQTYRPPPQTTPYQQASQPVSAPPPYPPQNYQQPPPSQPPPQAQQAPPPSYNQYPSYPSYPPTQPPPAQVAPPYPPPPQPNYSAQPPPQQQKPTQPYSSQPYHNPQYPPPPSTRPPPSSGQYSYPATNYQQQQQYKGGQPPPQSFSHGPPPGPQLPSNSSSNQPIARITGRR